MDLLTLASIFIFVATLGTVIMSLVSYGAFKLREWRRPRQAQALAEGESRPNSDHYVFFRKYVPPPEESTDREL